MYSAFINRYDASGSELLKIDRNTPYWGRNKSVSNCVSKRTLAHLFFLREEPRIHVHVGHPDGEAKFQLVPSIKLAVNFGITN